MREAVELASVVVAVTVVVVAACGTMEFSGMRLLLRGMLVVRETPMGTVTLGEVFAALAVVVAGAGVGAGD